MDCMSYPEFEELKRILRKMEDYLDNKLGLGMGGDTG